MATEKFPPQLVQTPADSSDENALLNFDTMPVETQVALLRDEVEKLLKLLVVFRVNGDSTVTLKRRMTIGPNADIIVPENP